MVWAVGDRVSALYDGTNRYSAVIAEVHSDAAEYTLDWEDGDTLNRRQPAVNVAAREGEGEALGDLEEFDIHWGASISTSRSAKGTSSAGGSRSSKGPGAKEFAVVTRPPPDNRGPVPNTHYVYPNLLCGSSCGLMSPEQLQMLVAAGVDTFVCLQQHYKEYGCDHYPHTLQKLATARSSRSFPPRELRFLHCPVPDHGVVSDESLRALVIVLRRAMDQGHVLYIHCYGGHGRTGVVVSSLIMATEGVEFEAAMEKLRQCHTGRFSMRGRQCTCCALSAGRLEDYSQKQQGIRMQATMARQHEEWQRQPQQSDNNS